MARKGLVSKGAGGPQSGGSAALMPKGEKPKGPDLIPLVEVARRLRVDVAQVESWLQKDQLRGNEKGVRDYDFKKFQFDFPEEIKRAQKEAFQEKQNRADRKPKKEGFWGKFGSFLGLGGKDGDPTAQQQQLVQENQRLKRELERLKKSKPPKREGEGDTSAQEEKIRYLEGKLSETRALESEVVQLRKQLSATPAPPPPENTEELDALRRELEASRHRMGELEQQSVEAIHLRGALHDAQRHAQDLEERLEQMEQRHAEDLEERVNQAKLQPAPVDDEEIRRLRESLSQRERNLSELQTYLSEVQTDNERLRQEVEEASLRVARATPVSQEDPSAPLVEELLELQRVNLERFRRLATLYQESKSKLRVLEQADTSEDLALLKQKYDQLLEEQQKTSASSQAELMEQLNSARSAMAKIKDDNKALSEQLQKDNSSELKNQIAELEAQVQELRARGSSLKLVETELAALRKGMQSKEAQVQKVAGRLAENEKRLAKAMQESARLTELLIERENRLRELSNEFEQEYRDKMENLDRQVSGLQWKLSLREERIASLEAELLRKGN